MEENRENNEFIERTDKNIKELDVIESQLKKQLESNEKGYSQLLDTSNQGIKYLEEIIRNLK